MQFYFLTQQVIYETIYLKQEAMRHNMKTQILKFKKQIKSATYDIFSENSELNSIKENVKISGCKINKYYFENVIFYNCNFQSSIINETKFVNCLFLNCNMSFCELTNCNFISCTIEDTLFYLTNSLNCNLLSCTFKENTFTESNLFENYSFNNLYVARELLAA